MSRLIRIQATGPFFELDYTVPEKKAAAELKRLKRIEKTAMRPIIARWQEDNTKRKYIRHLGYRYVKPAAYRFDASKHGIQPTTITTTVI